MSQAGGKSGAIQVSLIWFNTDDLDLRVTDPNNEIISYSNKKSRSGGELDVDAMNRTNPVENIVWPGNSGPSGRYKVEVHGYNVQSGPSRYQVRVKSNGQDKFFEGYISNREMRLIHEFTL